VGVVPGILGQGKGGFQARNQEEWFEALATLARNPDLRRSIGQSGRSLITTHYSVELVSWKLAKVFSPFL
jgi:glycosyltransferase involved in cell wall biosynthesis